MGGEHAEQREHAGRPGEGWDGRLLALLGRSQAGSLCLICLICLIAVHCSPQPMPGRARLPVHASPCLLACWVAASPSCA